MTTFDDSQDNQNRPHATAEAFPAARLVKVLEAMEDVAVIQLSPAGEVTEWSTGAQSLLGYPREAALLKPFRELFSAAEVAANRPQQLLEQAAVAPAVESLTTLRHSDGQDIPAHFILRTRRNGTGAAQGLLFFARDHSAMVQVEAESRRSRERFDLIAQATNDVIWDWDLETNSLWWNENLYTVFGYPKDEACGHIDWWSEHIHPFDSQQIVDDIYQTIESGSTNWLREYRFARGDGSYTEVLDRGCVIHDERHRPVRMIGTMMDITQRNNDVAQLQSSQERLLAALSSARTGTWQVEMDSAVSTRDANMNALLGLPPVETTQEIGDFMNRLHPDDRAMVQQKLDESVKAGQPFVVEYRVIWPDGTVRCLSDAGRLHLGPDGEPLYMAGACFDVTERKQIEAEREELLQREKQARQQAEDAIRLRDEFLNTLSHELRTPLMAILGWTHLLQTNHLDEDSQRNALETIERNARLQTQLIENVLDMSALVSGKLRLKLQALDASGPVEAAIETARSVAEAKGVDLSYVKGSGAFRVSADPDRLQQVVWNLLSNAIKFTPRGGSVQLALLSSNEDVKIAVSDTGQGISPQVLPFVFDRFRQADSSTTRKHGGLGVGLALVRHLAEMHGGTAEAFSMGEGQGSTFRVMLPLEQSAQHLHSQNGPVESGTDKTEAETNDCAVELKGLHVLIVDDEADMRSLVRMILEGCGARVTAAASAPEAYELFLTDQPDVLISDIGMPDEDGYSLMRRIRELPAEAGGQVPSAALTAYSKSLDRIRVLRSGFQFYIPKPVEPDELIEIVASLAQLGQEKAVV